MPAHSPAAPTPAPPPPRGCSSQRVRRLSRRLSRHFDAIVSGSGLKTTQYSLLCAIGDHGPLPPGELAQLMDLDASTLTRNLRPLIAEGWVELGAGRDARTRLVSVTTAGRAKRNEARRAWKRAQLALNASVGHDAIARLHAAVDECLARLGEADARRPGG